MKFTNTGKVLEVRDGIVIADGLSEIGFNEVVTITTNKGDVLGLALNLMEGNTVSCLGRFTQY
jgi:F0F1-type ATP synthase alpha subunit